MVTPISSAKGTKVPDSNHMDSTCPQLYQDIGPYVLHIYSILFKHASHQDVGPLCVIKTRSSSSTLPSSGRWSVMCLQDTLRIKPNLEMLFTIARHGADGVTTSALHHFRALHCVSFAFINALQAVSCSTGIRCISCHT